MTPPTAPPPIDAPAALRWQRLLQQTLPSPWLHEEVGQRMAQRLDWIKLQPAAWLHWEPVAGGLALDARLARRYPKAEHFLALAGADTSRVAMKNIAKPWWNPQSWGPSRPKIGLPPNRQVQMLWANMALHAQADAAGLLTQWQQSLSAGGFLMFSCLGPDTCRELQEIYQEAGWGPSAHPLVDMHDWGDLLVHSGFTEPVMDMERITLTFATPERALQELRGLGRNLHPGRWAGLRTPAWRARLHQAMRERLTGPDGQLALTFEIIYGHALKSAPRIKVSDSSAISLQDMRAMLAQAKPPTATDK